MMAISLNKALDWQSSRSNAMRISEAQKLYCQQVALLLEVAGGYVMGKPQMQTEHRRGRRREVDNSRDERDNRGAVILVDSRTTHYTFNIPERYIFTYYY